MTEFILGPQTSDFKPINEIGMTPLFSDKPYPYFVLEDSGSFSKVRFGLIPLVEDTYVCSFAVLTAQPNLSFQKVGTDCIHGIDYSFMTTSTIPDNNYSIVAAGTVPEWLPPNYTFEGFQKDGAFAFMVRE